LSDSITTSFDISGSSDNYYTKLTDFADTSGSRDYYNYDNDAVVEKLVWPTVTLAHNINCWSWLANQISSG